MFYLNAYVIQIVALNPCRQFAGARDDGEGQGCSLRINLVQQDFSRLSQGKIGNPGKSDRADNK
ncbi:hypothetical protein AOQ71_29200 [Bradyrhizobium manausense]|uniref:Uncharacterized protein n=1 Tax=Bradyrhizobium manausense TaxID=989370 RepID=A0A0R3D5U7_9BRAD|nr:hypothetical protein AOQ71_29200 [Bradyrhizobium manausense]